MKSATFDFGHIHTHKKAILRCRGAAEAALAALLMFVNCGGT